MADFERLVLGAGVLEYSRGTSALGAACAGLGEVSWPIGDMDVRDVKD